MSRKIVCMVYILTYFVKGHYKLLSVCPRHRSDSGNTIKLDVEWNVSEKTCNVGEVFSKETFVILPN